MDEAIALIQEKRTKDEQRHIKKFDEEPELEILNGRFGLYITYKGKNYKIPKSGYTQAEKTLQESMALDNKDEEKTKKRTREVKKKKSKEKK